MEKLSNYYIQAVICYKFQHFLVTNFIQSQFKNRGKGANISPTWKWFSFFQWKIQSWLFFFHNSSFPKCLSNSLCKRISAYGLFINSSISFFTKVWDWLVIYLFTYLFMTGWMELFKWGKNEWRIVKKWCCSSEWINHQV